MLTHLKIQNYALIQNLDIEFGAGLNIITGETGTGKSIILGALGLILGNRADSSSMMDPEKKCFVEGRFDISAYRLEKFFTANDLDWEAQTLLRREISPGGKSRAFINDTPVTLSVMKDLGEALVDVHSQHQTLRLGAAYYQTEMLDAVAGNRYDTENYKTIFSRYTRLGRDLQELKAQAQKAQKDNDYNRFQWNELSQAGIQPNEIEQLEEEVNLLGNAENIRQNLTHVLYQLSDDDSSVNNMLAAAKKQLGSVSTLNPALQILFKRLDDVLIEAKDISAEIEQFKDGISFDEERLQVATARLNMLNQLMNKHQARTETELINYMDELEQSLHSTETLGQEIEHIEAERENILSELKMMAAGISEKRKAQAGILQDRLENMLRQVGIPDAQVLIDVLPAEQLNEYGQDKVEILFSANKGARPQPVGQVASGGELSRLMLCFKYIMADSIFLPTIIFDEIDTGVSGEVAIKMGNMIKQMSGSHQVLCITHLPQIAAMADRHYVVYKISGEDLTITNIRQLSRDERVDEVAKMIGGHKPSAVAIENARELLNYQ